MLQISNRKKAEDFLLECFRFEDEAAKRERHSPIPPLATDEWEYAYKESALQGLSPLLCQRLKEKSVEPDVPRVILESLRRDYMRNAAANMKMYAELGKVLKEFKTAGIPVIVLKGAHLAEAVYRDIALRFFSDIDLLVKKNDLERADRILSADYIPLEYHRQVDKSNYEWHYNHKSKRLLLEIHWDLLAGTYPFSIDTNELWENAVSEKIAGIDVLVLSPADLVLHLCLHTSIHMLGSGIRALCDIVQVTRDSGMAIDWRRLEEQARSWRISHGTYLILRLARDLLNAAVPDDILDRLKPADMEERYLQTARDALFMNPDRSPQNIPFNPNLALLFGKKTAREKVLLLLKKAFPSPKIIAGQFPVNQRSIRVFLYYPAWIRTLLSRNARSARAFLLGKRKSQDDFAEEKKKFALMNWLISP
jgi:hypothetical protein